MRMRTGIMIAATAALLAGCEFRTRDRAATEAGPPAGDLSVEKGLTVSTPGFEGKVNIPGMTIGGEDMDLDGMKLQPGSKVTGIKVDARDGGEDQVRIAFTSDAAPDAVARHFREQGRTAGFAMAAPANPLVVRGTKPNGESFAVTVAPAGAGATGTIQLTDEN